MKAPLKTAKGKLLKCRQLISFTFQSNKVCSFRIRKFLNKSTKNGNICGITQKTTLNQHPYNHTLKKKKKVLQTYYSILKPILNKEDTRGSDLIPGIWGIQRWFLLARPYLGQSYIFMGNIKPLKVAGRASYLNCIRMQSRMLGGCISSY